uniref:subtilisin n=1 Tax=Lotharella globosa TaxID=91324 RepID=A0A7S3YW43_9EUKA
MEYPPLRTVPPPPQSSPPTPKPLSDYARPPDAVPMDIDHDTADPSPNANPNANANANQVVSNTSDQEVPLIFSTSYGEGETTTTLDTAQRTNTEFIKAGSRGISLLFASGDSGAGCSAEKKFIPNWPAGSPYVTGVGGTTGVPERAVGLASGGFCNRWGRQSWQADAVSTYLSTAANIPDQKFFNQSGRAFPDIAAQATGFTVVANMIPVPGVAGTSCASPTASGVFALLNDLRLAAGKSSLGFLNPFIYQNMDKFNDITEGGNSGCDGEEGFPAAKGWDPVTGVGTPNYEKLAQAVLALP